MKQFDIEVFGIKDHPDGSCTVLFDMSSAAMKVFAAIGLRECLIEKAEEILDGYTNAEGEGDIGSGEERDPPIP